MAINIRKQEQEVRCDSLTPAGHKSLLIENISYFLLRWNLEDVHLNILDGLSKYSSWHYRCCTIWVTPWPMYENQDTVQVLDLPIKETDRNMIRQHAKSKQEKVKQYTDTRRKAKFSRFQSGNLFQVKKPWIVKKWHQKFTQPKVVVQRKGEDTYLLNDGKVWRIGPSELNLSGQRTMFYICKEYG